MSYRDEVMALDRDCGLLFRRDVEKIAARADARIAELERECSQWRDELRIYRETESKRIAELEQSVTVRDTEIARFETDLELARRDIVRLKFKVNATFDAIKEHAPRTVTRRIFASMHEE